MTAVLTATAAVMVWALGAAFATLALHDPGSPHHYGWWSSALVGALLGTFPALGLVLIASVVEAERRRGAGR